MHVILWSNMIQKHHPREICVCMFDIRNVQIHEHIHSEWMLKNMVYCFCYCCNFMKNKFENIKKHQWNRLFHCFEIHCFAQLNNQNYSMERFYALLNSWNIIIEWILNIEYFDRSRSYFILQLKSTRFSQTWNALRHTKKNILH